MKFAAVVLINSFCIGAGFVPGEFFVCVCFQREKTFSLSFFLCVEQICAEWCGAASGGRQTLKTLGGQISWFFTKETKCRGRCCGFLTPEEKLRNTLAHTCHSLDEVGIYGGPPFSMNGPIRVHLAIVAKVVWGARG